MSSSLKFFSLWVFLDVNFFLFWRNRVNVLEPKKKKKFLFFSILSLFFFFFSSLLIAKIVCMPRFWERSPPTKSFSLNPVFISINPSNSGEDVKYKYKYKFEWHNNYNLTNVWFTSVLILSRSTKSAVEITVFAVKPECFFSLLPSHPPPRRR